MGASAAGARKNLPVASPRLQVQNWRCWVLSSQYFFLLNGLKCLTSSLQSYPRKASLPFQGLESGSQAPTPAFVRDSGHISKGKHSTDRLDSEGPSNGNTGAFVAASSHVAKGHFIEGKRALPCLLNFACFQSQTHATELVLGLKFEF